MKFDLGEIIEDLILDLLVFGGLGALRNKSQKTEGQAKTAEKAMPLDSDEIARKLLHGFDEARAEMFAFILSLKAIDPKAADALLRRHRERQRCDFKSYPNAADHSLNEHYKPWDENKYVKLLAILYVSLNGSAKKDVNERDAELEARKQVFIALGRMSDEEFDKTIELVNNNPVIQLFKAGAQWLKEEWPKIKERTKEYDTRFTKPLDAFIGWLDKKGVK